MRLLCDYLELSKARLCTLVVLTAAGGFVAGSGDRALDWMLLGWTLLGTSLAALGSNALNQCLEAERDGRMQRTRSRPLPAGRLRLSSALIYAVTAALVGPLVLALRVNALSGAMALLCEAIYLGIYTPLKTVSTFNTLVGAICGAIPPMLGWVAARGTLDPGAWVLGALLFVWQVPHFLALAWIYRDDYRRGGFCMLPQADPGGRRTREAMTLYTLALLPVGLMAPLTGASGVAFGAGSLLLGSGLLALALQFGRQPSDARARRVFLGSILYLPLVLGLLVLDRPGSGIGGLVAVWSPPSALRDGS